MQIVPASGWMHPTGNIPKSVTIIAMGPSRVVHQENLCLHDVPADFRTEEVWTLNTAFRWVKSDLLFVMDDMSYMENLQKAYIAELLQAYGNPIITSTVYQRHREAGGDIHAYPLQEIINALGLDNVYFRNSVPYMLAYAIFLGVEHINIFGADYGDKHTASFEAGRENVEYWIGYARAKGITVGLPDKTPLCASNKDLWFYGYSPQPVLRKEDAEGVPHVINPGLPATSRPGA